MDYTSWTLIHQASKMNAAGVDAFAAGYPELAVQHLNNALVIVNKLLLLHCDQYDLATRLKEQQEAQQQQQQVPQPASSSFVPGAVSFAGTYSPVSPSAAAVAMAMDVDSVPVPAASMSSAAVSLASSSSSLEFPGSSTIGTGTGSSTSSGACSTCHTRHQGRTCPLHAQPNSVSSSSSAHSPASNPGSRSPARVHPPNGQHQHHHGTNSRDHHHDPNHHSSGHNSSYYNEDDITEKPRTVVIPTLEDDKFYIYNRALLFSPPADANGNPSMINFLLPSPNPYLSPFDEIKKHYVQVSFYWSCVHFNMALVLHQLVLQEEDRAPPTTSSCCVDGYHYPYPNHHAAATCAHPPPPIMDRRYHEEAILFYKLCLQNLWVIPASSSTMSLLMLSAVNNLAHVYLNLHNSNHEHNHNSHFPPPPDHDINHQVLASPPYGARAATGLGTADLPMHAHNTCTRMRSTTRTSQDAPTATASSSSGSSYWGSRRRDHSDTDTTQAAQQKKLVQALLLRAIGKVIANDRNLTPEEHQQVTEMSVNHIVISALRPSYVAPGA